MDFEPSCGSCIHCDQSISGIRRMCRKKKELVDALAQPCVEYVDRWERGLFGDFPNNSPRVCYMRFDEPFRF